MAGSAVVTMDKIDINGQNQRKVINIAWTGASNDGTMPAVVLDSATYGIQGWYLYSCITNPGTTAPTDDYDITVTDSDGNDLAEGALADRDEANTEIVRLSGHVILGDLSVNITNNSVHSAVGVIKLILTAN